MSTAVASCAGNTIEVDPKGARREIAQQAKVTQAGARPTIVFTRHQDETMLTQRGSYLGPRRAKLTKNPLKRIPLGRMP